MAAPNAPDDSTLQPENWGVQDEQTMGTAANNQSASGASLAVDERSIVQDPENPDYPRSSSVGDNDSFREKQVKVLRSFPSVFCLLVDLFLGLAFKCWASMVLSLSHSRPLLLFFWRLFSLCFEHFF